MNKDKGFMAFIAIFSVSVGFFTAMLIVNSSLQSLQQINILARHRISLHYQALSCASQAVLYIAEYSVTSEAATSSELMAQPTILSSNCTFIITTSSDQDITFRSTYTEDGNSTIFDTTLQNSSFEIINQIEVNNQ